MSKKKDSTKPVVAVSGGSGYTGRFVIAELLSRKMKPIAIARNAKALSAANFPQSEVFLRQATVDDATSLDRALHGAQVNNQALGNLEEEYDERRHQPVRDRIRYTSAPKRI